MKRFTCTLIVMAVMIATLAITLPSSAAKGKKAYGSYHYGVVNFVNPIKDKAWSTIKRNSDLPVSNHLYVGMWVQYQEGNYFYWETPIEQDGDNMQQAEAVRRRYSLVAIWTQFGATAAGCDNFNIDVRAKTGEQFDIYD